jgi:glyoxylase-like metal-dependent hydrolase (beta-lactamase superfamily II)
LDPTVRYDLRSHHHFDHASGGRVFEETAQFVGHENVIPARHPELPGNQIANDTNGDGIVTGEEWGRALTVVAGLDDCKEALQRFMRVAMHPAGTD